MCDEDREMTEYERLELAASDARDNQESYLRDKGWKHSSKYPGSLWLWSHPVEQLYGVDFSTAWTMQQHIELGP